MDFCMWIGNMAVLLGPNRRGYSMEHADLPFTSLSDFTRIFMQCCTFLRLDPMLVLMYIYIHKITYVHIISVCVHIYLYMPTYLRNIKNLILRVSEMFFFQCCAVSRWFGRGIRRAPRPLQSLATELFTEVPVLMSFDLVSFQEFFGVFFSAKASAVYCQGKGCLLRSKR